MAVIRVSGNPGSGKTTVSKRLAEFLGYEYTYTGGIFRDMAKEHNLSIEDFYHKLKTDEELERSVDTRQVKLMSQQDNLVVEGRMAPFQACPFETINIFIKVEPVEGARRQTMRPENRDHTLESMMKLSKERVDNEKKRYYYLYKIANHLDEDKFDIVVDTTNLSPEQVFEEIVSKLGKLGLEVRQA
ncbi:MAG: AAA family ATPase [Candidatus Paceibacterota bacterium]